MTLNPSTMRLGIASILVGLVGAYGVRHMMEEEELPAEEAPEAVLNVPLAAGNLPAGRKLVMGDIGLHPMTRSEIDEKGWRLSELMTLPNQIVGRELKTTLTSGSPFLLSDIHLEGYDAGFQVTPGMRAAQVRVAEDHGGGQAQRGDTVDLLFTTTAEGTRGSATPIPIKTINVAEAVQVLHVDEPSLSEIHWAVGYKAKSPIFTLEVDPVTAGKITALKNYGDFGLVVRASDEPAGRSKGDGEYTLDEILGIDPPPGPPPMHSVEYWKRGQKFYKHFPIPQPSADQLAQQQPSGYQPPRPVADVLPDAPAGSPTPASRRPQPPYRPTTPSPGVQPPTPAPPSIDPPLPPSATGSSNADPFKDDNTPAFGAREVLP